MRVKKRFICAKVEKNLAEKCLFLKNIVRAESGRSSVRLEYTSGGRVVAGSNPVTPTEEKA